MPGDAFQVNGLPLASANSDRDMYAATQMRGSWDSTGAITRANVACLDRGAGYAVADTFHLINNGFNAATTPHDEVVTVTEVYPDGGIKQFTMGGQGSAYTLGFATAASDVLTGPRPAKFQINQVGAFTAAVITAIDVNANDIETYETYKVWVAGGSLAISGAPVGQWSEREVRGRSGKITTTTIAVVTGTYTVGQVLKIVQSGGSGGTITILTIDGANDIATYYVSARGSGYTVANYNDGTKPITLTDSADGAVSGRINITQTDDFTISGGTITFIAPGTTVGAYKVPQAGDWLKCVGYLAGQIVFPFTATQVGATPTVDVRSSSTGAKIVQVANPVAGALKTVTLGNAGGDAYEVGDILSVVQEGASGGKVIVLTLSTAAVATVAVIQGGSGYTVAANLTTVNAMAGSNDACTITVSAVATAGEYVTRLVTTTYALSGTGNLTVTFVSGGRPAAGELVRMSHTFALGNKVVLEGVIDPAASTPEIYKVQVDAVTKTLDTDYVIKGGLKLGTGILSCTTITATAAAGDIVELTQAGASGGQIEILTVDGSADVVTFRVVAAGTGYYAATGLGCTKVSGTGSAHSAIRFTCAVNDVEAAHIFFMANKSPVVTAGVHVFVETNSMVCVAGDAVEFDQGRSGGYAYQYIVPSAGAVCAVSYE
jgi:hypothetical protein